jgi:phosphoribosylaminoimidazolecarboxamide formyltransferase/IMP cyclohydrolase
LQDITDYTKTIQFLKSKKTDDFVFRKYLAKKAFKRVRDYDNAICNYFENNCDHPKKLFDLKYGLNPYQNDSSVYNEFTNSLKLLNGNAGMINILDALLGWQLVKELRTVFGTSACASYKHNSPAGVALGKYQLTLDEKIAFGLKETEMNLSPTEIGFIRARYSDPLSSFGDFIAISDTVDEAVANRIKPEVSDGIIAPRYTVEALEILKKKKKGNYVILQIDYEYEPFDNREARAVYGFIITQQRNSGLLSKNLFTGEVTDKKLKSTETDDLLFASIVLKYTQSNSVCIAKSGMTLGIGSGQQNRVSCVELAGQKTDLYRKRLTEKGKRLMKNSQGKTKQARINETIQELKKDNMKLIYEEGLVLSSDAFFTF